MKIDIEFVGESVYISQSGVNTLVFRLPDVLHETDGKLYEVTMIDTKLIICRETGRLGLYTNRNGMSYILPICLVDPLISAISKYIRTKETTKLSTTVEKSDYNPIYAYP